MPQRFEILHLLPSEQPFAMLARAVRDVLVEATPIVYDQLRQARRADIERLVGAAAAHFRQIPQDQRAAIEDRLELLARAQSVANLADQATPTANDNGLSPRSLGALLRDGSAAAE
jgi:hypothetical protein